MKKVNENNNQDKKINIVNTNAVAPKAEKGNIIQRVNGKRTDRSGEVHEIDSNNKKRFPFGFAVLMLMFVVVLMMWVSNYVELNECTREISEIKEEINDLKAEEKELNAELDKKYDLVEIERYAKDQLGMVDSSEVEKKYIEVTDDEKIEVYEVEENGTIGEITNALFALANNLIESWNNLIGNE